MKIIKENCVGCGLCERVCPEGIEMVDNIAEIKNQNASCLQEAADACPQGVIVSE